MLIPQRLNDKNNTKVPAKSILTNCVKRKPAYNNYSLILGPTNQCRFLNISRFGVIVVELYVATYIAILIFENFLPARKCEKLVW